MKPAYLFTAKAGSTVLLSLGVFASLMLAAISWPINSNTTNHWAGVFAVSAVVFVIGVVQCWRNTAFSKVTLAALAYAVILYGYVNWLAPGLPEPIGFSAGPNKQVKRDAPQAARPLP